MKLSGLLCRSSLRPQSLVKVPVDAPGPSRGGRGPGRTERMSAKSPAAGTLWPGPVEPLGEPEPAGPAGSSGASAGVREDPAEALVEASAGALSVGSVTLGDEGEGDGSTGGDPDGGVAL